MDAGALLMLRLVRARAGAACGRCILAALGRKAGSAGGKPVRIKTYDAHGLMVVPCVYDECKHVEAVSNHQTSRVSISPC